MGLEMNPHNFKIVLEEAFNLVWTCLKKVFALNTAMER